MIFDRYIELKNQGNVKIEEAEDGPIVKIKKYDDRSGNVIDEHSEMADKDSLTAERQKLLDMVADIDAMLADIAALEKIVERTAKIKK